MSSPLQTPPTAAAAREPRLVHHPAMILAGLVDRFTCETVGQIAALWDRFAAQQPFMAGGLGPASFGLCWEWRDGVMKYGSVVEVPRGGGPFPEGWVTISFPTARFAVFPHLGHISDLPRAESWILQEWLPASGQARARGLAGGVELIQRYGPRFDPQAGLGDVEVWLPLEG